MSRADFEGLLPRLVAAYESGRLVPFIGSGMSIGACPNWREFIERLEHAAGGVAAPAFGSASESEQLIRRANVAARTLRLRDPSGFGATVAGTLGANDVQPPTQTIQLARLWWPLVLTTNYDNCYVSAFRAQHGRGDAHHDRRRVQVLGRSPAHCQRVLASLTSPSDSILWALQGFVCAPVRSRRKERDPDLSGELVIGHQEYREVTNRETHFRRAFAEVFRSRSLFFLGSGLSEPYLLDLFGEVLEMYGPSTRPNYALVKRDSLDAEFMLARFQTVVVEYDEYAELPEWLGRLADAFETSAHRSARWTYAIAAHDVLEPRAREGDLVVVRSMLGAPSAGECVAVSGGQGRASSDVVYYSDEIKRLLRDEIGVRNPSFLPPRPEGEPWKWTRRFDEHPAYVVRARDADGRRDLRNVFPACIELFDRAVADGFRRVRMQLPSAGKNAVFPPYHSFAQVVRAFGHWRARHPDRRLELAIHVWKPSVIRELASGRLDVVELLSCIDIRFWIDIQQGARIERRLFYVDPLTTLRALCERLQLPLSGWNVEVEPAPKHGDEVLAVEDALEESLIDLGVAPGSTLRFRGSE